jgi:hypothetical protein
MCLSEHQWHRPSTSNCTSALLGPADPLVAVEEAVEVMVVAVATVAVAAVKLVAAAAVTAVTTGWTAHDLFVEMGSDSLLDRRPRTGWRQCDQ